MYRLGIPAAACLLITSSAAHALSCMVIGDRAAVVHTAEGDRSPAFLTPACESLRLKSGKASVSWVSRDGKPHIAPIETGGVTGLPSAGAEERSASLVWKELTSKREAQRVAYMRAFDTTHATRVFVPASGLIVPIAAATTVRLLEVDNEAERIVTTHAPGTETEMQFSRETLLPGKQYVLELTSLEKTERRLWRVTEAAEQAEIDADLEQIAKDVSDVQQQRILAAMLFEQRRLPLNLELSISHP